MAKSISEEELQLRKRARRRLIGAIALVTIVAVFLPMVLEHEPKPVNQDISTHIPSPNSGAFTSKIVPVAPGAPDEKPVARVEPEEPAKSAPPGPIEPPKAVVAATAGKPAVPPVASVPAYDSEAAPPKKAAVEPQKLQSKAATAAVDPPPAKTTPAAADKAKAVEPPAKADAKDGGSFVVQVAAFNDAAKAKQMQDQIVAAGVKSYTEVVPTKSGNVTRVRAGPFVSRAAAEKVRDKLKEMGLNGNIVAK